MLIGDIGDDSYQFTRSTGKDTVVDTDHCPGSLDIVQFGANIASCQLWFRHVGNDLEVSIIGTTDWTTPGKVDKF